MTRALPPVVRLLVLAVAFATAAVAADAPAARAQDAKPPAAADAPLLVVRPKVGDVLRFRYRRTEKSILSGAPKAWEQSREIVFACTVAETPPGGGAVLDFVEESAKGRFPLAVGTAQEYDSAAKAPLPKDEDALTGTLVETFMVGVKARVTLDAHGAVTKVSGVRDAAKAAFKGSPLEGHPSVESSEFETGVVSEFFPGHPEAGRVPGASWTERVPGRMGELMFEGRPLRTMRAPSADAVTVDGDWTGKIESRAAGGVSEYSGKDLTSWSRADGLLLVATVSVTVRSEGPEGGEGSLEQTFERIGADGKALAAPTAAPAAAAGPPVTFGISAKPGAKATFRYTRTCTSTVKEMGGGTTTDDITREYTVLVKAARPGGGATLEVTYGPVSGRFDRGTGAATFDSAKKEPLPADPVAKLRAVLTSAFAGKKVEVDVDASGAATAVRGAREIVDAAAKGQDFGPIGDPMKMLKEKDLLEMASEGFVPCLGGAHAAGSAWTVNATRELGSLTTGFDETFTLRSADAARATVEETYAYDPAPGAMEGLRAEGSGRSVWNRTDGLAESVTREWTMTGRGKFTVDGARTEKLERIAAPAAPPKPAPKGK